MKVRVKFGDSRSNCSRDVRLPHFLTNDDDDDEANVRWSSHKAFCLQTKFETGIFDRWLGIRGNVGVGVGPFNSPPMGVYKTPL